MIGYCIGITTTKAYRNMPSHEVQCALAYQPEQLFDLAADIERYPEFLPWWVAARIQRREDNAYYTDQIVGFGVFRERFATKTVLQRPERIVVVSADRMFRNFDLTWRFDPLPDNGCRVVLLVDLELRSKMVQDLFHQAINRTVGSVMSAFEARAHRLYAPAANRRLATRNASSSNHIV